ncbi:hypothetical protein TRVA0_045S01222 [Trichomonascus vanleenenianus]|uniref:uncharacterized protein n=1 Tax=Trichomonascus vanleenenianus TaxID=2268995 RepID=UPI003ECB4291
MNTVPALKELSSSSSEYVELLEQLWHIVEHRQVNRTIGQLIDAYSIKSRLESMPAFESWFARYACVYTLYIAQVELLPSRMIANKAELIKAPLKRLEQYGEVATVYPGSFRATKGLIQRLASQASLKSDSLLAVAHTSVSESNSDTHRAVTRHFSSLEPCHTSFLTDKEHGKVLKRAYFAMTLTHPAANWPPLKVEALFLGSENGEPSALALCSDNELIFPPFLAEDLDYDHNGSTIITIQLECRCLCDRPKVIALERIVNDQECVMNNNEFQDWQHKLSQLFCSTLNTLDPRAVANSPAAVVASPRNGRDIDNPPTPHFSSITAGAESHIQEAYPSPPLSPDNEFPSSLQFLPEMESKVEGLGIKFGSLEDDFDTPEFSIEDELKSFVSPVPDTTLSFCLRPESSPSEHDVEEHFASEPSEHDVEDQLVSEQHAVADPWSKPELNPRSDSKRYSEVITRLSPELTFSPMLSLPGNDGDATPQVQLDLSSKAISYLPTPEVSIIEEDDEQDQANATNETALTAEAYKAVECLTPLSQSNNNLLVPLMKTPDNFVRPQIMLTEATPEPFRHQQPPTERERALPSIYPPPPARPPPRIPLPRPLEINEHRSVTPESHTKKLSSEFETVPLENPSVSTTPELNRHSPRDASKSFPALNSPVFLDDSDDEASSGKKHKPKFIRKVSGGLRSLTLKFKSNKASNQQPDFKIVEKPERSFTAEVIDEETNQEEEKRPDHEAQRPLEAASPASISSSIISEVDSPIPGATTMATATVMRFETYNQSQSSVGTAVCINNNNATVEPGTREFNSSDSYKSLPKSTSTRSDVSDMTTPMDSPANKLGEKLSSTNLKKPKTVTFCDLDSAMSVGRLSIFRGNAYVLKWANQGWNSLLDNEVFVEVTVSSEGGVITASVEEEGPIDMEMYLQPEHEVRKSTALDVQIQTTNHITMFRLRSAGEGEKFHDAVKVAQREIKSQQPVLYGGTPSMNSSESSLASISAAAPGLPNLFPTEDVHNQLLLLNNLKCNWYTKDFGVWASEMRVKLSVFSAGGATKKRVQVRSMEEKTAGQVLFDQVMSPICFQRVGKVGIGMRRETGDGATEVSYMLQFRGDKEARFVNELLTSE